jgi:lysosomal acid lipase/cholesteryl ester hydrolase
MMGNNDIGGSSTKNIMHWSQMIRSGRLAQFDYGTDKNLALYNSTLPPLYEVETLATRLADIPITLFVGSRDVLVPE